MKEEVEETVLPVIMRARTDKDLLDDDNRHADDANAGRRRRYGGAGGHLDHVGGNWRSTAEARLRRGVGDRRMRHNKLVAALRADPIRLSGDWEREQGG